MAGWLEGLLAEVDMMAVLNRKIEARLDDFEYDRSARRVLLTLLSRPQCTDKALSERLGMGSAQLSRTIGPLIDEGLIEASDYQLHKRQRLLSLSEAGESVAKDLHAARLEAVEIEMAELTQRERTVLLERHNIAPYTRGSEKAGSRPATLADAVAVLPAIYSEGPFRHAELAEMTNALSVHFARWYEYLPGYVEIGSDLSLVGICLLTRGTSFDYKKSDDSGLMMIGPWVHPRFRKRGIAKSLLRQCVTGARELTFTQILTRASSRQPDLVAFLEQHRFRRNRESAERDPSDPTQLIHAYTKILNFQPRAWPG